MTMLERYLYAVQSDLPKDQSASDIVAEIGDHLQSEIEAREASLGRPLTDEEEVALIRGYGHPRVIAGQYARVQYLIGPRLLPFYWSALAIVTTVVISLELLGGSIAALVAHDGLLFFEALGVAWHSLIWIFGIVTIAFAVSERVPSRNGRSIADAWLRWDPRRLPAPSAHQPVPRGSSVAEFIANFLALLLLLDAGGPHRLPASALVTSLLSGIHATLTPAWQAAYVGLVTGTALIAASAFVVFVQPRLTALRESVHAIASLVVIAGIGLTLQAGPWVQSSNQALNTVALYTLVAATVVLSLQVAFSLPTVLRRAISRFGGQPARKPTHA